MSVFTTSQRRLADEAEKEKNERKERDQAMRDALCSAFEQSKDTIYSPRLLWAKHQLPCEWCTLPTHFRDENMEPVCHPGQGCLEGTYVKITGPIQVHYQGARKPLYAWSAEMGISFHVVLDRLRNDWPIELAFKEPVGEQGVHGHRKNRGI